LSLTPGTRLGVYEVTSLIGEGGMGQVYRATDTKLKRQVAIKILPPSLAADHDRLTRFQREAEVLASLNHPNIAHIHGLEEGGGGTSLVMELVEGEDLSQRLARGAIPLDEALPIARQITEALEAAHEQGIIHRDLKPANIKVRADGTVKVLDFGLAKAMDPAGTSSADLMNSPTMIGHGTQVGMIVGTAAYMSPEQARGKAVDRRADIWAFGAVLFEMVTGTRAFPGEDLTDTLAAVVRAEPEWSLVPREMSPTLLLYLRRCLHKDPKQRIGDIHDVRLALDGALDVAAQAPTAVAPAPASRARLPWIVAAISTILAAALAIPAVRHLGEAPPSTPLEIRTDVATPGGGTFALSPDGRQLAFVASSGGTFRLWLRSLSDATARPLAGTDGALNPFWSPDSRSIAFFTGTEMRRLDLAGGAPQTVASAGRFNLGTWGADGVILYSENTGPSTNELKRVPVGGGAPTLVTPLGPDVGYFAPLFLPDGKRFVFTASGKPDAAGIYLGTLDGSPPTRLTADIGTGSYFPSALRDGGWLVWLQTDRLVAQRLDLAKLALVGETVSVADDVEFASVSSAGLMAYRTGAGSSQRQLAWFDARGTQLETVGEPGNLFAFDLSPDGKSVAMTVGIAATSAVTSATTSDFDIWILEVTRGLRTRFTFTEGMDRNPIWSPDGRSLVFASSRSGHIGLYKKAVDGAVGSEELLYADERPKQPHGWSPDGKHLLFSVTDPKTKSDLLILPMTGERKPFAFAQTQFTEAQGVFSSDGRWIAYVSDESGSADVYAAPFPGLGGKRLISTKQAGVGQGGVPVWRRDGKEIFYIAPDRSLMAVELTVKGTTLEAGLPRLLFGPIIGVSGRNYAVSADGKRFLTLMRPGRRTDAPITLVQNWRPEAKQ
jgi:serine/threonine protein kinase/Tol biopolymer transport system component